MTLIEIMVVVIIMAMLAVAVAINVLESLKNAKVNDAKTRARTLQSAAVAYMLETGSDCPDIDEITPQLDPTTEHTDPWQNDYRITCEGTVVHVASAGPDGDFDTEDDVAF
jgi:type II secretory pathway pseudopilin PulG